MADAMGWSTAQWDSVNAAARETFLKASVISQFLPRYGPLPESAAFVRTETMSAPTAPVVTVTDDETTTFFTFEVHVELSSEQVADPDLTSAMLAFRRSANILAQTEDRVFFNGYNPASGATGGSSGTTGATGRRPRTSAATQTQHAPPTAATDTFVKSGPDLEGLTSAAHPSRRARRATTAKGASTGFGERLVTSVVDAVATLEDAHHPRPFACILDNDLFAEAHRPVPGSMVLPVDRIKPLLEGPLLRSGQLPRNNIGIVVSLSANDIDVVVAKPPTVQFLNVTNEARYRFRLYAKSVLRIKDVDPENWAVTLLDLS
jgi:uncharacterized linocin/CFP29 family protein